MDTTGNFFNDINYTVEYTAPALAAPANRVMTEEIEAQWADIDNIMGGNNATLGILGALLGGLGGGRQRRTAAVPPNFMAPVVVRPTEGQIAEGSRVDFVGAVPDTQCAICQTGFGIGEERRTLSYCDHEFHRSCIDPWFEQNVHCPVCRHDIRDQD